MKKLLMILVLGLLWCNIGFASKYLDAYTLDKKKIENKVIKTLSTKHSKLTKYKNWEGKLELYKVTKPNITFFSARHRRAQRRDYATLLRVKVYCIFAKTRYFNLINKSELKNLK